MNFKNAVNLLGFWTCSSVCRAWQPCNAIAGRWRVNNPNGWAVFFFVERADFNYTLRNYLAHYKWLWQFISNGVGHWARYIMSTFFCQIHFLLGLALVLCTHSRHYHNEPNGSSDKRLGKYTIHPQFKKSYFIVHVPAKLVLFNWVLIFLSSQQALTTKIEFAIEN